MKEDAYVLTKSNFGNLTLSICVAQKCSISIFFLSLNSWTVIPAKVWPGARAILDPSAFFIVVSLRLASEALLYPKGLFLYAEVRYIIDEIDVSFVRFACWVMFDYCRPSFSEVSSAATWGAFFLADCTNFFYQAPLILSHIWSTVAKPIPAGALT